MTSPSTAEPGPRRLLLALWVVAMGVVAAVALPAALAPPPGGAVPLDKVLHAVAFAGLAGLPVLGFARWRTGVAGALAMIPFGAVIEVAQSMTSGRSGSLGDIVADAVGVVIGLAAAGVARRVLTGRGFG